MADERGESEAKMSFKDRLAMFNKPQAEPQPPPKGPKPIVPRKTFQIPTSQPAPASSASDLSNSGFSASDAKDSIGKGGGSLKDRIAALQGLDVTANAPGTTPRKPWRKPTQDAAPDEEPKDPADSYAASDSGEPLVKDPEEPVSLVEPPKPITAAASTPLVVPRRAAPPRRKAAAPTQTQSDAPPPAEEPQVDGPAAAPLVEESQGHVPAAAPPAESPEAAIPSDPLAESSEAPAPHPAEPADTKTPSVTVDLPTETTELEGSRVVDSEPVLVDAQERPKVAEAPASTTEGEQEEAKTPIQVRDEAFAKDLASVLGSRPKEADGQSTGVPDNAPVANELTPSDALSQDHKDTSPLDASEPLPEIPDSALPVKEEANQPDLPDPNTREPQEAPNQPEELQDLQELSVPHLPPGAPQRPRGPRDITPSQHDFQQAFAGAEPSSPDHSEVPLHQEQEADTSAEAPPLPVPPVETTATAATVPKDEPPAELPKDIAPVVPAERPPIPAAAPSIPAPEPQAKKEEPAADLEQKRGPPPVPSDRPPLPLPPTEQLLVQEDETEIEPKAKPQPKPASRSVSVERPPIPSAYVPQPPTSSPLRKPEPLPLNIGQPFTASPLASPRSPVSRQASLRQSPVAPRSSLPDEPNAAPEKDSEGVSGPVSDSGANQPEQAAKEDAEQPAEDEVDEEVARRQRIAARMAALGGQKVGMFPMMGRPLPARKETKPADEPAESQVEAPEADAPAPVRPKGSFIPQGGIALPGITRPPPPPPTSEPLPPPPTSEPEPELVAATEPKVDKDKVDTEPDNDGQPQVVDDLAEDDETPLAKEPELHAHAHDPLTEPPSAPPPPPPAGRPGRPLPAINTAIAQEPSLTSASEPLSPSVPPRPSGGHSKRASLASVDYPLNTSSGSFIDIGSSEGHPTPRSSVDEAHASPLRFAPPPPPKASTSGAEMIDTDDTEAPPPVQPRSSIETVAQTARLSNADLEGVAERIGTQIFAKARAKTKDDFRLPTGQPSSAFVAGVLAEVSGLQPATAAYEYGFPVWSYVAGPGQQPYVQGNVRLGDVAVFHHCKLKSKLGAAVYLGNKTAPHVAIVADELDAKKFKVRVFETTKDGKVEQSSHHLDHLKEGRVVIYRVLPA